MPAVARTKTAFAQRLTRIRNAKGLTQMELSRLTGISPRVIGHYETLVTLPTADVVVRLAKALGVSVDQLLGRRPVKIKESVDRKTLKMAKMFGELGLEDKKALARMIERFKSHPTQKP